MRLRHRPGRGLVVGLCGLAAMLLSFFALPWISEGGDGVQGGGDTELTFKVVAACTIGTRREYVPHPA